MGKSELHSWSVDSPTTKTGQQMNTEISLEKKAEILRKTIKTMVAQTPLRIANINEQIVHLSKAIGEKPEEVAGVLKPVLLELIEENFEQKKLENDFKEAEEGYDARHHSRYLFGGGGH